MASSRLALKASALGRGSKSVWSTGRASMSHTTDAFSATSGAVRAYDAASTASRLSSFATLNYGPQEALFADLPNLIGRSRYLVRNNPQARRIIEVIVNNVVANGFRPTWDTGAKSFDSQLSDLWEETSEHLEIAGQCSFGMAQRMILRSHLEGGECFIRSINLPPNEITAENPIPYRFMVLESEQVPYHLSQPGEGGDTEIRMGIEVDKFNRRVAYHFHKGHPHDKLGMHSSLDFERIPASDVRHVYECRRPGQLRGEPQLAPVIVNLWETGKYDEAELQRKMAAALILFWYPQAGEVPNPLADGAVVDSSDPYRADISIEPGTASSYDPQYGIPQMTAPPDPGAHYPEFQRHQDQRIMAGAGVTYEQGTGDLSQVNFSSARMGRLEVMRAHKAMQEHQIHAVCRPILRNWMIQGILSGHRRSFSKDLIRAFQHNPRRFNPRWKKSGFDYVNPLDDVQADILRVQFGFASRKQIILERGGDPDQVDRENEMDPRPMPEAKVMIPQPSNGDQSTNKKKGASALIQ